MHNPLHALIIDDDVQNLEVLGNLLTLESISFTAVEDPASLPGMVDHLPAIDIVFLDLQFPDTDGYQVLQFLRDEIGITSPIVACTVHLNESANAFRQGFTSFVGKPLDLDRFPEQIKRILKGERVWEAR
jgi:two-component system, cell cycle response regulator DivK